MNLIAECVSPDRVRLGLDASTRDRLFEEVGQICAAGAGLDAKLIADSLKAREQLGSTGLGQGIAFPHARVKGLHKALASFVRVRPPIPFDAPDGKPVADFLILLVPEQATEAHLGLLAAAAQMFSNRRFRDYLRDQDDAVGVCRAFADWPAIGE